LKQFQDVAEPYAVEVGDEAGDALKAGAPSLAQSLKRLKRIKRDVSMTAHHANSICASRLMMPSTTNNRRLAQNLGRRNVFANFPRGEVVLLNRLEQAFHGLFEFRRKTSK